MAIRTPVTGWYLLAALVGVQEQASTASLLLLMSLVILGCTLVFLLSLRRRLRQELSDAYDSLQAGMAERQRLEDQLQRQLAETLLLNRVIAAASSSTEAETV